MSSQSPTTHSFGPFRVCPRTRELFKYDQRLKLRPQPFAVLELLVARPGELVTRQELKSRLWPEETFVDFERGLNTAIKELRGALSDSAGSPRYIETLPRLGYRFIGSVETAEPAVVAAAGEEPTQEESSVSPEPLNAPPIPAASGPAVSRRTLLLGGASLLAVLCAFWLFHWERNRSRPQPADARLMLAVLPFDNLTGDPAQDYFSDGFTEEMIGQLGRIDPQHLGVIARSSVMQYKKDRPPLDTIGRNLGVQYLLTGAVRREDDQVRISAQLVQLKDDSTIWSRQYDRELSHFLTLQSDLAQEISGEIRTAFGGSKAVVYGRDNPRGPKTYEAYDLYLKGIYFWNKRTPEGFERAVSYFQQAIAKDPDYAPAYSGLANSYALISGYTGASPRELMPKAHAAALHAVALDDSLAEVHTSLAIVAQDFDWDWPTAEREYRRAIELNPNYATAHHWYAEYLALMGRFDEAFAEMERAKELDPLSLIISTDDAFILYYARRYEQSAEQFRKVLDMEPYFPRTSVACQVYVEQGKYPEALSIVEHFSEIDADNPWHLAQLAYVDGRAGKIQEARRNFERILEIGHTRKVDPLAIAVAAMGVNEKKLGLQALENAYAERSVSLTNLKVTPIFDPLRGEPGFQDLLRRMNLAN